MDESSSKLCYLTPIVDRMPMKKWLTRLIHYVGMLLLGAMLTLAFAPYGLFPFAMIAPACLLYLSLYASPKHAFLKGFAFGLGFFGSGVSWVFISIHTIGEIPTPLAGLFTFGLIAALSMFPATVGYLTNRYFPTPNTTKIVCAYPAIWVMSEWARSWLFTGFPWLFLGYSQTNSPLKGFAPIFSVYGVSLAIMLTSALIVNAIIHFKQRLYRVVYLNLFAAMLLWIMGDALSLIPWTHPVGKAINVALVQGDIAQEIKWSPEHLALSFERYTQLTAPLWGKDKLIIWPETAIPLPLQDTKPFIEALNEKAKASGSHLILGIPIGTADGSGYYNAIVTLGESNQVYTKRQLVPFGEYTPLLEYVSRIFNAMNIPLPNVVPGKVNQEPLTLEGIKILTSICYEIAYPDLIRSYDKNIGFLLTVTNDAWFGKSNAQAQHLQIAKMRALELRRSVLFVSNDGITAIINPAGEITASAPAHQVFVLHGTIQPMMGITPWMRNGTDPVLFIVICLLITAIRSKKITKTMTAQVENGRTIQTTRN